MAETMMDLYAIDWEAEDKKPEAEDPDSSDEETSTAETCPNRFEIRVYGRDANHEAHTVSITDFCPYFFVKIPETWILTETKGRLFIQELRKRVKPWYAQTLCAWKIIKAKPLYGFTADDQFHYMKLEFTCLAGFNQFKYLFKNKLRLSGIANGQPVFYEPFESNIPPLLRFLHVRNLKAVGWLHIAGFTRDGAGRYTVKSADLSPLDREDTPKIVTLAFDIECDSSHGDFPVANKDYQKLAQDIMTEYLTLRQTEKRQSEMLLVVATFLKYAFHPFYSNNNIVRVVPVLPGIPAVEETVEQILKHSPVRIKPAVLEDLHQLLDAESDLMTLVEFMETHFPPVDTQKSDYYTTVDQLRQEYTRLKSANNVAFRVNPLKGLTLLLELVFDPRYTNWNINHVEVKQAPRVDQLIALVPRIQAVCEAAHGLKIAAQRLAAQAKAQKVTKASLKTGSPGEKGETVNGKIAELTKLLNEQLPAVLGDPLIQIGSTFKKQGETDCYMKHIICLDTCEPILRSTLIDFEHGGIELPEKDLVQEAKALNLDPSDPEAVYARKRAIQYETDQAVVIVESYATEAEVLLAWQRLIRKMDPDLIVGYNIFGFDFKYVYDRACYLGIADQFLYLGRLAGVKSELVEQKLSSAALGDNLLHYISMSGRILIDLYNVVQKLASLSSYKLDDVCREFLYKNKVDITPAEIFTKQKGSAAERRTIAEYCLIDCILCNRLMDKLEILSNNTGMAQVCSVPLSYLFLRGQGVKLLSYVAKECRAAGLLLPVIEPPTNTDNDEWYEGAIVLEPEKAIHVQPVGVLDFNSLYPSCMISENLTFEHFIGSITVTRGESVDFRGKLITSNPYEKQLLDGGLPGWDYVDITYDTYTEVPIAPGRLTMVKAVSGHTVCRFAQPPNGEKGLIPRILMNLLASRKSTRKKQAGFPKGGFEYNLYEGLQLAYKVTANSLYGIIGANTSKIKLKEIAACTTAVGRGLIHKTADHIRLNFAGSTIVYGDTDSVFIKFDYRDDTGAELTGLPAIFKCMELCIEAARQVNLLMKKPHNIEFEKVICPFVLISKKRYLGHYYTTMGSPKYSVKSMGVVTKRRDNANIVKHVFGGMIDIIMREQSVDRAIEFVREECRKVLTGKFPIDMFIITKTLRSYYALPESIAHNVLAQRIGKRDPGNKPRANDRIAYAYIVKPGVKGQGDRIETPDFIQKNKLKLDYPHYITNQIAKPVAQIFELTGKGDRIFDELLQDYHGVRRITDLGFSCIQIKSRAAPLKFTERSESSDDSDSEND